MSTLICLRCSNPVERTDNFCTYCGKALETYVFGSPEHIFARQRPEVQVLMFMGAIIATPILFFFHVPGWIAIAIMWKGIIGGAGEVQV